MENQLIEQIQKIIPKTKFHKLSESEIEAQVKRNIKLNNILSFNIECTDTIDMMKIKRLIMNKFKKYKFKATYISDTICIMHSDLDSYEIIMTVNNNKKFLDLHFVLYYLIYLFIHILINLKNELFG